MAKEPIINTPFIDHLDGMADSLSGASKSWLDTVRQAGRERYSQEGLPTPRVEAWKFTNLRPLQKVDFRPASDVSDATLPIDVPTYIDGDVHRAVIVNGRFRPDLSKLDDLPDGVTVGSLARAIDNDEPAVQPYLGQVARIEGRPLLALNTAFIDDGLFIHVPRGQSVEKPIEVLFVGQADDEQPIIYHPRNLFLVEDGGSATVVEFNCADKGKGTYFSNLGTEVVVGDEALLRHYRMQDDSLDAFNVSTSNVRIGASGNYDNVTLSFGGRLSRNEIHARLEGETGNTNLNGGYMLRGEQHVDNCTLIEHMVPHATSNQTYHGVLDGRARAVFQGKIHVHQKAQKTDAYQLNRALLLSERAEIDSKPELEIYADDVKCSHGATAGYMDDTALFYLRARGIPEKVAQGLLIEAFVNEVVEKMTGDAIIEAFKARAWHWLHGGR